MRSFRACVCRSTTRVTNLNDNQSFRRMWDSFWCHSNTDWFDWIRKVGVDLLQESPSTSLRTCSLLASVHYPLVRELFNAAFISCWSILDESIQVCLVHRMMA